MKHRIEYLLSSPQGDIHLEPEDLSMPFLIKPSCPHPFLTLGDYFDIIRNFVLKDGRSGAIRALFAISPIEAPDEMMKAVVIRSEKHGLHYHVSSVEFLFGNRSTKIAVNIALSKAGRNNMRKEYDILNSLNTHYKYKYIPNTYGFHDMECVLEKGRERFTILASEWLDNYHEWHLSEKNSEHIIRPYIWDTNKGYRFATMDESITMFREISKILTLYFDTENFCCIDSWHHSAGDFVVNSACGIKMSLITVRKYRPLFKFSPDDVINPQIALVYFFLDTILRTRLDKVEGTGTVIWAHEHMLPPSIDGFFSALQIKVLEGRYRHEEIEKTLHLLKSFSREELEKIYDHLLILSRDEDPEESRAIREGLPNHITNLYSALQNYHSLAFRSVYLEPLTQRTAVRPSQYP